MPRKPSKPMDAAATPVVPAPAGKPSALVDTRVIFCGDNRDQLPRLPDACVDLIYIDPPFNSNRNYEVFWGETKETRAFDDRHKSTQAYIEFMQPICVQLARVLKKTGSFYYHCDWHACHYVKVMLDRIFGESQFQSEIIWKRTSAHSSARRYGPVNDNIFFYTASDDYTWNEQFQPYDPEYINTFFDHVDPDGRRWKRMDLTGDGIRNGESGGPWRGIDVTGKGRHWAIPREALDLYGVTGKTTQEKLDALDSAHAIHWPKKAGGMPRLKVYADKCHGVPLQTIWTDIRPIHNLSEERLGYPTQKPLALLERIIKSSSNANDIVLDAFCGCGTAIVAAENLGRQWIGIDTSPTACRLMAKRLRDVCHIKENEKLWQIGRGFVVRDLPWSIEQLRKIPPFEFENWAVIALGGIPNKAQIGDMGIDGRIYPVSAMPVNNAGDLGFMDQWFPIQAKQMDKVGRPMIDEFETAMNRAGRTKGYFIAFGYSSDSMTEIQRFFTKEHKVIVPLTVQEILDEQIGAKLA